ncbi:MAG: diacylglycerol kinase family lipid kinase [Chloroflexi bacterium]|nr:diacylglycerol kinase family lipid kinase [Chloroflexota bacterium]
MTSTLIIVNPASANGATAQRWPALAAQLRACWPGPIETVMSTAPGHAIQLASTSAGRAALICVGGDGTVNEVINGLMHINATQRPPLALVQSGTGGDFARALGLPKTADAAVASLASAQPRRIDVGEIAYMKGRELRTRYFINVAGLGFDAEVSHEIARAGERGHKGKAVYFLSVFKSLSRLRNHPLRITLMPQTNGDEPQTIECRSSMVAVCNGGFFGGGMHIAPHADPSDGAFDIVLLDSMSQLEFLLNFPRVYRGTHLTHPKVRIARVSALRIEQMSVDGEPVRLQAEGELLGTAPVSFRLISGAIEVLV